MPANPYAGYRPRPAAQPDPMNYQPDAQASYNSFMQANPGLFGKPQVTSTFGGKPMSWTGVPPLQAGSTFMGGRVMAGAAPMNAPGPVMSAGPTRGGQGAGQGAAGPGAAPTSRQPTGVPGAPATGIPAEIQRMFNEANAANKDRYGTLLDNEKKDKGEVLQALGGWNSIMQGAQADRDNVQRQMNGGWDAILNLAGQNGIQSDLERERRRAKNEQGAASQSLANRGLGNTTIVDSTRRGIVDDSALREQAIYDQQRQRELGVRQNMLAQTIPTQMRLNEGVQGIGMNQLQQLIPALQRQNENRQGIIERRSDEGPNLALWAQVLQQQGATQQSNQQTQQALAAAAQSNSAASWQAALNSILGQMPQQYGRPTGSNRGPGMGGWRRPSGGGEQHTGAQDVNNGGYNSNPGGYSGGGGGGPRFVPGSTSGWPAPAPAGTLYPAGSTSGPPVNDLPPGDDGDFGGQLDPRVNDLQPGGLWGDFFGQTPEGQNLEQAYGAAVGNNYNDWLRQLFGG